MYIFTLNILVRRIYRHLLQCIQNTHVQLIQEFITNIFKIIAHRSYNKSTWTPLTLNLLTTTIVALPSNASKWQMGFNSAFKGLRKLLQL
jgi:hypothetical protein